jgi:hypothetical protein
MILQALKLGERVSEKDAALLTKMSRREYEWMVRRIKMSELPFAEEDLWQDRYKNMPDFGMDDPAEYVREARQVVRHAYRILAHVRDEKIQFQFFSERGFAVVDRQARIRGYYAHLAPGALEKAFANLKTIKPWLQIDVR